MSRFKKKKRFRKILTWGWKFFFKLLFVLLILTMTQVLILRFVNPPFTAIIALNWLRDKVNKNHYEIPHYYWRQLKEISPNLRKAVMAGEDQRFLSHHGFDFIEIDHAVRDILKKRRIRGASTITMQTARTVFLWPGRSWLRKMLEVYYTVLIEIFWSKDRIFEIYLNTVDWGNGIMGAEAASKKYFHVHSDYISIYQGALLAAILPSPHRWSPNNPNQIVRARQKRIMNDMKKMPLL